MPRKPVNSSFLLIVLTLTHRLPYLVLVQNGFAPAVVHSTAKSVMELELHLETQTVMLNALRLLVEQQIIDPISLQIATDVSPLARTAACVQARYALRRSELAQIDFWQICTGAGQSIREGKTSHTRRLNPFSTSMQHEFNHLIYPSHISIMSVNEYGSAVARAVPRWLSEILIEENHASHIFRHLHASWMAAQGYTLQTIQEFFGHAEQASTSAYLNHQHQ